MTTPTRDEVTIALERLTKREGAREHTNTLLAYITHLEQSLESAEREAFEAGLSIGSRNPGIHETPNVYDTYKGNKTSKGAK